MGATRTNCKYGHAYAETGRYKNGDCRACRRGTTSTDRSCKPFVVNAGRPRGGQQRVRVPVTPIVDFMARMHESVKGLGTKTGARMGVKPTSVERVLHRALRDGTLTIEMADDLCIALGRHPVEVYGSAWFTYGAEVADAV